jgi:hypothetical protein
MQNDTSAFDIPPAIKELVDLVVLPQLPQGAAVPAWYYDYAMMMELGDIPDTRFRMIGEGRYVCIVSFLYTKAIIVGELREKGGYVDRWCFHTMEGATRAFDEWKPEFAGGRLVNEPLGWHRHPNSGRYREHGDPGQERVR